MRVLRFTSNTICLKASWKKLWYSALSDYSISSCRKWPVREVEPDNTWYAADTGIRTQIRLEMLCQ